MEKEFAVRNNNKVNIEIDLYKSDDLYNNVSNLKKDINEYLRQYYSKELGETISLRKASLITQAIISFICCLIPFHALLWVQIVPLVWFAWSVYRCKHAE